MKIIKRYANRRMYDSDTSKTITLDEVAEFIKAGKEIQVIDNSTGEDITSRVLGQTFLKVHEGSNKESEPLMKYMLTALIRESEQGLLETIKKLIYAGIGFTKIGRGEIESLVTGIVNRTIAGNQSTEPPPTEGINIKDLADRGQKEADKLLDGVINTLHDVTRNFRHNVADAIDQIDHSKKLGDIIRRLDEIAHSKLETQQEKTLEHK